MGRSWLSSEIRTGANYVGYALRFGHLIRVFAAPPLLIP